MGQILFTKLHRSSAAWRQGERFIMKWELAHNLNKILVFSATAVTHTDWCVKKGGGMVKVKGMDVEETRPSPFTIQPGNIVTVAQTWNTAVNRLMVRSVLAEHCDGDWAMFVL